jgi:methyltransferase family protein
MLGRTMKLLRSRRAATSEQPHQGRPPQEEDDTGLPTTDPPLLCWPLDHYYSPVPDNRALMREPAHSRVFTPVPRSTPGIDWRAPEQVALVRDLGHRFPIEFPDGATGDPRDYHPDNGMFSRLDAWMLQAMVRHFRPRRVIETGCGWSSLVTARVNREYLGGAAEFTCIEPHPPDFLGDGIDGISKLIVSRVEELPVDPFLELESGDVLFIDTSHVAKTGGDVVFLYQEVLPRLAPGVVVHIHDMFIPWDYPEEWVRTGRAWNEQYLVRAFLAFNSAFQILLSVAWMSYYARDALSESIDGYPDRFLPGGGSLWLRRV